MTQQFVDIDNSRKEEQKQVMREIIAANHCPFCLENLRKYHKQEIIKDGRHWILTYNQWPYDHTKLHLLLILKKHVEHISQLDPAAGQEMIEIFAWAEKKFAVPGGGIGFRFGDTNYSAGTVNHLHAQFIVPDIEADNFHSVGLKIGKEKNKRAK